jgi:hypothetical protein
MKTRRSLCSFAVSLVLLLFSGTASAVMTLGSPSCGQWVRDQSTNGMQAGANRYWLAGYLSGLAVALQTDSLTTTDSASIELWMDNYCRANPLKGLQDGGVALFRELQQKAKPI